MEKKCYHAIRDGFPQLFREQLFFGRTPTGRNRCFSGILGLRDLREISPKNVRGPRGKKVVRWNMKIQLVRKTFFFCRLEKQMLVGKKMSVFGRNVRNSLECNTEKR